MLHHVTGKHEWSLGGGTGSTSCEHGELPPCNEYLAAGSPPHAALVNIAMDKSYTDVCLNEILLRVSFLKNRLL